MVERAVLAHHQRQLAHVRLMVRLHNHEMHVPAKAMMQKVVWSLERTIAKEATCQ